MSWSCSFVAILASTILSKMNKEIHPCDDFYLFACGSFTKSARYKNDTKFYDTKVKEIYERYEYSLQEETTKNESKIFKKLKNDYKICMDEGVYIENN